MTWWPNGQCVDFRMSVPVYSLCCVLETRSSHSAFLRRQPCSRARIPSMGEGVGGESGSWS